MRRQVDLSRDTRAIVSDGPSSDVHLVLSIGGVFATVTITPEEADALIVALTEVSANVRA